MRQTHDYAWASIGDTCAAEAMDVGEGHVYHPKQTTCLRCGNLFDSFDPRYNRRCVGCAKSVQGQDDRFTYNM